MDVVHRKVTVQRGDAEDILDYDLLIGSDGVRSRVREAMNSQLPPGAAGGFLTFLGPFLKTSSSRNIALIYLM